MAAFLRLLLAFCLVATAVPAPMAHAATGATLAAPSAVDDALDGPPCHGSEAPAAADAPTAPDAHGCCTDGGACEDGCGCLHAAGLPTALPPATAETAPAGPPATAIHSASPPRLPPPVRPPIA